MLRTFPAPASLADRTWRLIGIAGFTLLMALSAKISIEIGPVPFTMQPLVVLLAGMVLGGRDGMVSMMIYALLIASGQPLDTRGLGTAAFASSTGGFLIGFIPAAAIAGYLVERSGDRLWQRWIAGLVGVAVIYLFGAAWLSVLLQSMEKAWTFGVVPFIGPDVIKALLAAGLTESLRLTLNNQKKH